MSGQEAALSEVGGALLPNRQVSAEKFRSLMAKLKSAKPDPASTEEQVRRPAIVEPAQAHLPEPQVAVAELAVEIEEFPLPQEIEPLPDPLEEPQITAVVEADVLAPVATPEPEPAGLSPDSEKLPDSKMLSEEFEQLKREVFSNASQTDRAEFLLEVVRMVSLTSAFDPQDNYQVDLLNSDFVAIDLSEAERIMLAESSAPAAPAAEPVEPAPKQDESQAAGDLARSLMDMMLSNANSGLPQERALAADALLKLVPRIPLNDLVAIVDRVSIMEQPPHMLVSQLILDSRIEVAGPLLENCGHINDQILARAVAAGNVDAQRLIARRRVLSTGLTDRLVEFDDSSVMLTLVRNNGASFSHQAFLRLADHARKHHEILAPLATRTDLPPPVAFELFWFVPAQLRRYLLSRFLTDSEMLTKILKITHAIEVGDAAAEPKSSQRERAEQAVEALANAKLAEAAAILSEVAAINGATASRIIADQSGEPLAVAFKAIGVNRARFEEIIELLKQPTCGIIGADRATFELQNVFDSLSFNKARVLLTYWDWATLKTGPYAPAA